MQVTSDTQVTLTVTIAQANVLLNSLSNQEWRVVNDLILELRTQIQKQIQPSNNVQELRPGAAE